MRILRKFWVSLNKILGSTFPLNIIRVNAFRLCGFIIGRNVYIGSGLLIITNSRNKSNKLIIGERVSIAPRVTIVLASGSNNSRLIKYIPILEGNVKLCDDCWIGTGSIILPGITIGEYAIVAAGSVVTKDVEPFTVVAGVPAKVIKKLSF